ncbi:MAG: GNAT family N-acetyltransferase [Thermoproteota archaeon]
MTLIGEAKKMGPKILILKVFATNSRAIHVYKKVGFEEVGRIPNGLWRCIKITKIAIIPSITQIFPHNHTYK